MAYFDKYIRQILSRKESVTFPGFGSLIIKEEIGQKEGGKINPPGAMIKFDPDHPKDDMKLTAEYAEGEGIDEDEAGQQLLELVDAIKFKLDKGESYSLALVGKFTRDDDNRIHFQKDPNWVIDPELFGLETLELLELENDDNTEIEEVTQKKVEVEKTSEKRKPSKKEKAPQKPVARKEKKPATKKEKKPVNKWKIIWIVIGSLIAVLVLILLIPAGPENNAIEFGKEGIVIRNTDKERLPEVVKQQDTQSEQAKSETADKELTREPDSKEIAASVNNYFIIAGSFQNMQNASILLNRLTSQGYPAEIIYTENRLYRVSVKSFPSKEGAISELNAIKASPGLENVWVWKSTN